MIQSIFSSHLTELAASVQNSVLVLQIYSLVCKRLF